MKQKIDFILYEGEETRLVFRFYPRQSYCEGKYAKPPKSWNEVYEVAYSWSILEEYKDEDEGPNWQLERRPFYAISDENSVIQLIAEYCNALTNGYVKYIWEDTNGIRHINKILDCENFPFGDGVTWIIHKYGNMDYYEFSLWDFDNTGYRFTLPKERLKSFGEYLKGCCDYMLEHSRGNGEE